VIALLTAACGVRDCGDRSRVTFNRDVAPIVFTRCAPCHRPGQAGPFSLLRYADVRAHGRDIADVVGDRYMPPWKPSDRNGRFAGDRSLRDADIALIRAWVADGMPEGSAADLPALPRWPKSWQLGEPDAVVRMDAPYALAAQGQDEYRNFVIASPVHDARYVIGWEFHANGRAIHHAILKVDRMGNARRADAADPQPGFGDMEFDGAQAPDGFYLVWAPGKAPARATDGSAWRLDARTDLVLQLHMQRTGKVENVAPEIALYFSDQPPTQRRYSVRVGDLPIDIAPGDSDYHMTDSYTLPAAVRILSMFPHAHYVANKVRVWSSLPDGSELELLRIDDWDFNWQDEYAFVDPPLLPSGSTLHMQFSYDNSDKNPRNPNHPPRRVRDGTQSTDEMGNVTFQALPARAQDLDALLESKYRRQLSRSGRSADGVYNLANALSRQGKTAEAIEQYRAAIALDPKLKPAHYNLAGALVASGAREQAGPELEASLAIAPEDLDARLMLGSTLAQLGRNAEAITQYERALELDPKSAAGHVMLGDALRATGKREDARAHYTEALKLKPDWGPAREGLNALAKE
jgi:tetratricopeptide (TPR) repeat protein